MNKAISLTIVSALAIGNAIAQTLTLPGYVLESVTTTGLTQPTTMAFVSPTTMLVCQKGNGQLKRVVNGTVVGDAIDLAVNSNNERGLLGICLSPDFATSGFVYLYYSRPTTVGDSTNQSEWADNRVERFVYNGTTLTYDSTILVIPTDATQSNGPNHNAGIIMIGPDQKLYVITGDLNRSRAEQNNLAQSGNSASVGGIYRLNLDGSIPADNLFSAPFAGYFAYGIRNSFGMTFDPMTGYVWATENGPTTYDEVNCFPAAGMNSGWSKIMGPDSRDPQGIADLVMLPGATYRDPEFSWLNPIAVTSILFPTGGKYASLLSSVLLGDNNFGNLYKFDLNATRDGFVLSGTIADEVADDATERGLNVVGTGFSITTDMKIGPDGYIYGVSLGLGDVWRIVPQIEEVPAATLTMFRGSILGGSIADLPTSDDLKLVVRPGAVLTSAEAPVQIILETTNPAINALTQLSFISEASATATSIQEEISFYNFTTAQYELLNTRTLTGTDSTATVNVNTSITRFIEAGTKKMRVRLAYRTLAAVLVYPWQVRIDKAVWRITR